MAERELYSGRYEILRHLARGGMAEVYLARDHLLDRPVALKVLFPEYARDEAFVERFRREARSAANLNHPNIVAVYDWGEEAGTYFIVMEYVEGLSLRDLVREEAPLLPERAAEVTADVAAALGYAHRHGVVHRDVKPGNILITPQGQVKVTDFGIAQAGASEHLTRTGMVMGTASYFSPEQAQGRRVDPRSDVYSLGIVLYETLTGEPPFSGDDPVSIAYQHVREEPVPPGVGNPEVPVDLENVVLTALTKAPGDRYPSAEDMREDLLRFVQGLPVESRPVTAVLADDGADATVANPRPDRTAVAPAAPPDEPPDTVASRPRRRRPWVLPLVILALLLLAGALAFLLIRELGAEDVPRVAVPGVEGLQLEEARAQLEERGLEAEAAFEENDEIPENEVFAQDPEEGTEVEEGGVVRLTVSRGATQVEVPDVTGEEFEDARETLRDAGFEVSFEQAFSDDVDEGRVISTEPAANTQAEEGSVVAVVTSQGSEPVEIPDVTGEDEAIAANILGREGFDVETVDEPSSEVEAGHVIRTEPAAREVAPSGATVTMVVSSGPAPVEVPDVIDDTEGEARDEIRAAGLEANSQATTSCDLSDEGHVVDQTPSGGTEVDPGSTVTIFVCEFVGDDGGGDGGGGDGGGGDGGGSG